VLGPEDDPLVDALAAGLGRVEARVLAYLLLRSQDEFGPASRLAVRVGTDLGRKGTGEALSTLEDAALVRSAPIERGTSGRPRKGWEATDERAALSAAVRRRHAERLLERARTVTRSVAGTGSQDTDVGVVGSAVACRALAAGRPVAPVALLYQRAMTVLYTVRSVFGGELTSVEQLRGRTVAMPPGAETALLGRLFLSQADILDDTDVIEAGGEWPVARVNVEYLAAALGVRGTDTLQFRQRLQGPFPREVVE
jgi:hypothetical protein